MNLSQLTADIQRLLAEPQNEIISVEEIHSAIDEALRQYSADTRYWKGTFEIKEILNYAVREPKITDFWWGIGRNMGAPFVPMPPQPLTPPAGNGYPYPLKEPEVLDFGYQYQFNLSGKYAYPEDFIQTLGGETPNGFMIRPVHSYPDSDVDDYPSEISDDLSDNGLFTLNPEKRLPPLENITDESGFGIPYEIEGFEFDSEYGIPSGGFGTVAMAVVQGCQGAVRYVRKAKLMEVNDTLSICFYAIYLLLQIRSERESLDRSLLFKRLYDLRICRIRVLERKNYSISTIQGTYF